MRRGAGLALPPFAKCEIDMAGELSAELPFIAQFILSALS
jgi:hypothetical protein